MTFCDHNNTLAHGYLLNRQTLVERMTKLNESPAWSGYDKAVKDLRFEIQQIDDQVNLLFGTKKPQ